MLFSKRVEGVAQPGTLRHHHMFGRRFGAKDGRATYDIAADWNLKKKDLQTAGARIWNSEESWDRLEAEAAAVLVKLRPRENFSHMPKMGPATFGSASVCLPASLE